jgi:hypothetical protein
MTDMENPGALAGATGARDTKAFKAAAGAPEDNRNTRAEQVALGLSYRAGWRNA